MAIFGLCYALCLKLIELEVEQWDIPYLTFETHWLSNIELEVEQQDIPYLSNI